MEALCENNAQQSGVANVRHKPQNRTWIGELAQGNRFKTVVFFSKKLTNAGVSTMPKKAEGRFQFFIHNAKFISRSVILINSPGRPLPLLCFPFVLYFLIHQHFPSFLLMSSSINTECQQQNDVENKMSERRGAGGMRRVKVGIMNNYKRATTSVLGLKLFSYQMKFAITCVHRVNSPGHAMKMRLSVT